LADYIIGLMGMWLFCDGIISVKLYWRENWITCHSIRLIRIIIGVALMIMAAPGVIGNG